jgi:Zn finger protein HypA/HybF involved in hydrogenase expression
MKRNAVGLSQWVWCDECGWDGYAGDASVTPVEVRCPQCDSPDLDFDAHDDGGLL